MPRGMACRPVKDREAIAASQWSACERGPGGAASLRPPPPGLSGSSQARAQGALPVECWVFARTNRKWRRFRFGF